MYRFFLKVICVFFSVTIFRGHKSHKASVFSCRPETGLRSTGLISVLLYFRGCELTGKACMRETGRQHTHGEIALYTKIHLTQTD